VHSTWAIEIRSPFRYASAYPRIDRGSHRSEARLASLRYFQTVHCLLLGVPRRAERDRFGLWSFPNPPFFTPSFQSIHFILFKICPVSSETFLEIMPIGGYSNSSSIRAIRRATWNQSRRCSHFFPNQVPTTPRNPSSPSDRILNQCLVPAAAPENGLHPPLCIRIQVSHHGECLSGAL
jgi:hypothetical protein